MRNVDAHRRLLREEAVLTYFAPVVVREETEELGRQHWEVSARMYSGLGPAPVRWPGG